MRLKRLEIIGFKSFADKTAFDFEGSLTALVGPNGSGKSNVVDALKWVLGEQSARKLRGQEMGDMIFGGSSARKALSCAEVRLTLHNDRGILPVDYEEVCIARRLYRSGEGEYVLNGSPCRLKDIRALLMDTGVGVSAYSVIEQGQVDMLLQASSKDRRLVLEEAAGIHRYLAQKKEAERKLERVRTNLERVGDIISELERQLRSVRYQAAKARKYKRAKDELRTLSLALSTHKHRNLLQQANRTEQAVAEQQAASASLADRIAALKTEHAAAENALEALRAEIAEADERLSHAGARHYALGKEIEMNRKRCVELQQRHEELRRRRAEVAGRMGRVRGELAEGERALRENRTALQSTQQVLQERAGALQRAEAECSEFEALIEQQKATVFELLQQESQFQNQIEMLAAARQTLQNRLNRQHGLGAQLAQQCEGIRLKQEAAELDLRQLADELAGVNEQLATLGRQTGEAAGALDGLTAAIADLKEQANRKLARRQALEELHGRGEGIDKGVKLILDAIASSDSPLAGAPGMVGELLDVPRQHARALDAALGHRVQAIVVHTEAQADEALALLSRARKGRGEVIALEWLPEPDEAAPAAEKPSAWWPVRLAGSALRAVVGFLLRKHGSKRRRTADMGHAAAPVVRMIDMVQCARQIVPVARVLLANCFMVEDAQAAAALLRCELPSGAKVVTRQGECFERRGLWSAGESEVGGFIERKSELAQLATQIGLLQHRIECESREAVRWTERIKALEQETAALVESREGLTGGQKDLQGQLSLLSERRQQREEELQIANSEQAALQEEIDETDARVRRCSEDLRALAARREGEEQQLTALRDRLSAGTEARAGLSEEINGLNSALARLEEQQNGLTALVERLKGELEHRDKDLDHIDSECEAGVRQEQEATGAIQRAHDERIHLEQEKAQIAECARDKSQVLEDTRSRIAALEADLDRLGGQREERERALSQARMSENEIRLKCDNLLERSGEECGVHLEALELEPDQWRQQPLFTAMEIEEFRADSHPGSSERVAGWYAEAQSRSSGEEEAEGMARPVKLSEAIELREAVLRVANAPDTDWAEVAAEVEKLRKQVAGMGGANLESIREQEELEERSTYLTEQREDLDRARRHELELIRELSKKSRESFVATFETVRQNFQALVRKLFGGGSGDIVLEEDAEDVLEAGIEIAVRPPGKETRSISLLSGGEKSLAAVALLFAIFEAKPSPFCLLDEVDAALDDVNISRFTSLLQDYTRDTQFIIVTHSKLTMSTAERLYGISLQEDGTSRKVAVEFEEVDQRLAEMNRETAASLKRAKAG